MTLSRFYMCWFELVDLWTNDIDRDQYVDFLQARSTCAEYIACT